MMHEIGEMEIRQFYKEYMEVVRRQDHYESILYFLYMKPEQKEKWFLLLREKCAFQKKAFQKNDKQIKRIILPFLQEGDGKREFTDKIADTFLEEIIEMAEQSAFDSLLTVEILKKLVAYYTKQNNRDKLILSYFYLGYFDGYINDPQIRQEVYRCYQKVVSYRNQYEEIQDARVRRAILVALFNRTNWDTDREEEKNYNPIHMSHLLEAYEFYQKEEKRGLRNENFDSYNMCMQIENEICAELLKTGGERAIGMEREIEARYYQRIESEMMEQRISAREYYNYWKYQMQQGEITEKDYYEYLYQYYREEPWQEMKGIKNYEDSYSNETQMMPLFLPELFRGAKKYQYSWTAKLKEDVKWYYTGFPRTGNKAYVDRKIVYEIIELMPNYEQKEAMELYENVLLARQGNTEIHVQGVAKLATEIAGAMIDRKPECVVGVLGTKTPEQVVEKKKEILKFLHRGALHHDRGKLLISTTINMQLRSLTDQEFETIKKHPEYGLKGGENYESLKQYYNIILGHHKYYNGKGGYPQEFDNQSCEDKYAIDLITICDCIDAATDFLGRNYISDKDVHTVLKEMDAEKGVRYSPDIIDFIRSDEKLIEKLEKITTEEREKEYYRVYSAFAKEKNQGREEELSD